MSFLVESFVGYEYLFVPFLAWLIAGCLKFAINSVRAGKLAFGLIGYGGLPSNHSAIVSSVVFLIGFREGIDDPAFGVAVALAFIVMLDANSLRRQVGKQAAAINFMNANGSNFIPLRERIGHAKHEILAGVVVGFFVSWSVYALGL